MSLSSAARLQGCRAISSRNSRRKHACASRCGPRCAASISPTRLPLPFTKRGDRPVSLAHANTQRLPDPQLGKDESQLVLEIAYGLLLGFAIAMTAIEIRVEQHGINLPGVVLQRCCKFLGVQWIDPRLVFTGDEQRRGQVYSATNVV